MTNVFLSGKQVFKTSPINIPPVVNRKYKFGEKVLVYPKFKEKLARTFLVLFIYIWMNESCPKWIRKKTPKKRLFKKN